MKHSIVSKIVGTGILVASVAVMPLSLPVVAQTDAAPNNNMNNDNNGVVLDSTPLQETKGDGGNLGWLGILGLIGLANLFRKPEEPVAYREPDVTSGTNPRF